MIKILLYVIVLPFTVWCMEGLNLNSFFKQSRVYQARIMYLMLATSISYLVVNFIYDFIISFKIV
jgi:uncharacterized membrane protein YwzB